jgi:hypothetical protein
MKSRISLGIRRSLWPALVVGVVAAVLVYVFLSAFAFTRWEAIGVVRIGQTIGTDWLNAEAKDAADAKSIKPEILLMPISLTAEYMRHPSFGEKVKARIGRCSPSQEMDVGSVSYWVRRLISGNIEIRARATSRECAQEFIKQAVAELKSSQDEIYRERMARIELEMERVELRLQEINRLKPAQERQGLSTAPKSHGERLSDRGSERAVSVHLLEAYRHVLEERFDRSLSYPTDLFTPVVVSAQPVEPNWMMHGIYSFLSGVMAAFTVFAVRLSIFAGYLRKGEEN